MSSSLPFSVRDLNQLSLTELFAELIRDGCLDRLIESAKLEDFGPGPVSTADLTSLVCVPENAHTRTALVCRSVQGTLAGAVCLPALTRVFAPDVSIQVHLQDGSVLNRGSKIATIAGPTRQVLGLERTMLNLLSRLSGVATRTQLFVRAVRLADPSGKVRLLDTRKTTPGLRNLEKYAVRCGGGYLHRLGLFDAVLIKDNHIAQLSPAQLGEHLRRTLGQIVRLADDHMPASQDTAPLRFVELELDSLMQLESVLAARVCGQEWGKIQILLLDNMAPVELTEAVRLTRASGQQVLLEASGGVTLETIPQIALTGIDRISVGGLTHSAISLDLALDTE